MIVDRLGAGINLSYIRWPREDVEQINPLIKRLDGDPLSPPANKVRTASPLLQTMAQYSASGTQEMPILMSNDAGLPLGTGFDSRKPEQLLQAIRDITGALGPYGVMRGWIWSSNWWIFDNNRASAAASPEEKSAFETALKKSEQTGEWSPVLDTVMNRRFNYAVDAQAMFNQTLRDITPGQITAVAAPYRNIAAYPPVTFSNVDEVDLHIQWEQMAVPYTEPYNVDFYKRPGKRAWAHPEVWNDDGTGGQILPNLFLSIMRGSDGVGVSGELPGWQFPDDPRNCMNYTESIHRQLNAFLREYGPWLTTLKADDSVAIVADGRMFKLDNWHGNFGLHFARLLEAYITCLHAHRTPCVVFVEDMTPQTLAKYKAILLVDQRVEMEPELITALSNAKAAGVPIFCDGTCRPNLVDGFTTLGISFDHLEKDPSSAGDDDANWRFSRYGHDDLPAVLATLGKAVPPIADVSNEEVLVSQRQSEKGKYLFVVNHTTPELDPGELWRMNLSVTTRVPLQIPVGLKADGGAVYEVLGMQSVTPDKGTVQADLRCAPARIFAILPATIDQVKLSARQSINAGDALKWNASVLDAKSQAIDASVPMRVQLIGADGSVITERFVAAGSDGASGSFTAPLNVKSDLTLVATELLSGRSVQFKVAFKPALPSAMIVAADSETIPGVGLTVKGGEGSIQGRAVATDLAPADLNFGPHIREIIPAANDSMVVMNAFNWDDNLYAVDAATGKPRWQKRIGQYFTFSPQTLGNSVAVQGFDFQSAEGYHLYFLNGDGSPERRFALYGVSRRLPHRFVPGYFWFEDGKPASNFATAPDGSWIATDGDLGAGRLGSPGESALATGLVEGQIATLRGSPAQLDAKALLAVDGLQVLAYEAGTGRELWRTNLAPTGKCQQVSISADGRRIVVLASNDGGTVFALNRDGKVAASFPSQDASDVGAGRRRAVDRRRRPAQCRFYSLTAGLQWLFHGDDHLRTPRFAPDGKRLTFASDLGSVYVLDGDGTLLMHRDQGSRSSVAWMANGDLLIGNWAGEAFRLD